MAFSNSGGLPELRSGTRHEKEEIQLSLTRRGRTKVDPELYKPTMQRIMAWRPNANFIDGELDNRAPGKVTGWMRFFSAGTEPLKAVFDLTGDFHEDIRGKVIRFWNTKSEDEYLDKERTYMEGFSRVQRGTTGDITAGLSLGPWTDAIAERRMAHHELFWEEAGLCKAARESRRREYAAIYRKHIDAGDLFYPYVMYPYIEWYSKNGRVVLELEPSQMEIVGSAPVEAKSPGELAADDLRRISAFGSFLGEMVNDVSRQNREQGGDGNVFGAVVE
jgi:hypothetical protein